MPALLELFKGTGWEVVSLDILTSKYIFKNWSIMCVLFPRLRFRLCALPAGC